MTPGGASSPQSGPLLICSDLREPLTLSYMADLEFVIAEAFKRPVKIRDSRRSPLPEKSLLP